MTDKLSHTWLHKLKNIVEDHELKNIVERVSVIILVWICGEPRLCVGHCYTIVY